MDNVIIQAIGYQLLIYAVVLIIGAILGKIVKGKWFKFD